MNEPTIRQVVQDRLRLIEWQLGLLGDFLGHQADRVATEPERFVGSKNLENRGFDRVRHSSYTTPSYSRIALSSSKRRRTRVSFPFASHAS
jgi:hypothetical protein